MARWKIPDELVTQGKLNPITRLSAAGSAHAQPTY